MKKTGFYIIKDRFFEDMPDPYLKGNKAGNRPHYYCFEDNTTGILNNPGSVSLLSGLRGSSANIRILSFTRMGKPVFIGIFII